MIDRDLLITADERFRLLIDGVMGYAIFMLDPLGVIVTWNAGATRIKGYTEDEILGRHFSVFFVDDDVRNGKPEHLLSVAVAAGRANDEGWRVRKDGSRFWANVVITALTDDDGTLRGFAKVTRDDTDRREAQQDRLRREILEVREGIGHELHHDVIQQLFGVGLLLTGALQLTLQPELGERLTQAVADLDAIIHNIRTTLWASDAGSATDDAVTLDQDDDAFAAVGTLKVLVVEDDPTCGRCST